jgi:hypothetical protein
VSRGQRDGSLRSASECPYTKKYGTVSGSKGNTTPHSYRTNGFMAGTEIPVKAETIGLKLCYWPAGRLCLQNFDLSLFKIK